MRRSSGRLDQKEVTHSFLVMCDLEDTRRFGWVKTARLN
jgi:hypothetical protein